MMHCKRFNKINIKRKPFSTNSIKDDLLKTQCNLDSIKYDLKQNHHLILIAYLNHSKTFY